MYILIWFEKFYKNKKIQSFFLKIEWHLPYWLIHTPLHHIYIEIRRRIKTNVVFSIYFVFICIFQSYRALKALRIQIHYIFFCDYYFSKVCNKFSSRGLNWRTWNLWFDFNYSQSHQINLRFRSTKKQEVAPRYW